jgi:uncharacterized protein with PQ loop repeat
VNEAIFSAISLLGPIVILVPQIRRIISKESIEGIDLKGLKMGIAATLGWLIYGITNNLGLIWIANLTGLVLLIWIAQLFTKLSSDIQLKSFGYLSLPYGVVLLLLSNQSTISIGLVCSLISLIGPLQQVVRVFKDLNLRGLSATTFVNAIIVHTSWIVYGLRINDPYIIFPNFYAISIASLLLFRIVKSRWPNFETTQNLVSYVTDIDETKLWGRLFHSIKVRR